MGIEPTDRMLYIRPNGFEDRGRHQAYKHFQQCHRKTVSLKTEAFQMLCSTRSRHSLGTDTK